MAETTHSLEPNRDDMRQHLELLFTPTAHPPTPPTAPSGGVALRPFNPDNKLIC